MAPDLSRTFVVYVRVKTKLGGDAIVEDSSEQSTAVVRSSIGHGAGDVVSWEVAGVAVSPAAEVQGIAKNCSEETFTWNALTNGCMDFTNFSLGQVKVPLKLPEAFRGLHLANEVPALSPLQFASARLFFCIVGGDCSSITRVNLPFLQAMSMLASRRSLTLPMLEAPPNQQFATAAVDHDWMHGVHLSVKVPGSGGCGEGERWIAAGKGHIQVSTVSVTAIV